MPMDKSRYPADWDQISLQRRQQAGWCCEWCGAENGKPHPVSGKRVVLTVHHCGVDKPDGSPGDREDKMDNRPENLAALCQPCHLMADRDLNAKKAAATKYRKQRELAHEAGQRGLFNEPVSDD